MKKIFFLIVIHLAMFLSLNAQQTISYEYDEAGNRIARKVVVIQAKTIQQQQEISPVIDEIGKMEISIFPNPTKGMLSINITHCDIKNNNSFTVYNLSGNQLFNGNMQGSGEFSIDMSEYIAGIYILVLVSGEEKTSYKIIKM